MYVNMMVIVALD